MKLLISTIILFLLLTLAFNLNRLRTDWYLSKGMVGPAAAADPFDYRTRYALGTAYLRNGQISEAIEELTATVKLFPGYLNARNNLAVALFLAGYVSHAEAQWKEILRQNPTNDAAQNNLQKIKTKP